MLTDREVEAWLRVAKGFCAKDRCKKQSLLPVIRIGRACRYARKDVQAFLDACRQAADGK